MPEPIDRADEKRPPAVQTPGEPAGAGPSPRGAVLVTGGAGFIGSHVCGELLRRGRRVRVLDSFDAFYPRAIKERNLQEASAEGAGPLELIEADLCDTQRVLEACQGCETVIHLAARAGVRPSIEDPSGYVRANVMGTMSVLEAAQQAGVRRVVAASSSSVYGNASRVPFSEADTAVEPISPYAATKRSCELIGYTHHHLTRMPVAMLRFFTVFGPRQRPDLAISKFLGRVGRGEPIQMFGDGTTSRDYTFIDDIVTGVLAAEARIDEFGYRVWNLGGDRPTSLRELIEQVGATVGRVPEVERLPMQPGDVERTWADLQRSRTELGYRPSTTLARGLERQWAWMGLRGADAARAPERCLGGAEG